MAKADLSLANGGDEFDPSTVPAYPKLQAEIRDTDEGEFVALVDGEVITTSLDQEPVRAAIVATAAHMAKRRLGEIQAVRVRIRAADGGLFETVVTGDGTVYDVTAAQTAGKPTAASAGTKGGTKGGTRRGTRRGTKAKPKIDTPDADGASRRSKRHPMFYAIVGFPVVMILVPILLLVLRDGDEAPQRHTPSAKQLPIVTPQGYSPVAGWAVKTSTTVGGQGSQGAVAADDERVYAVAGVGDEIKAYDAGDGVEEWSSDVDANITAGPALSVVDDRRVVVVATSTNLTLLDPSNGREVGSWDLDIQASAQVTMTPTGPVVSGPSGQANSARIISGHELVTRIMPAGALPVAPGPDGSLIAVTRDRVYASTSSELAGEGQPIDPVVAIGPTGTTTSTPGSSMGSSTGSSTGVGATTSAVTVAGWTGEHLVLAYPSTSSTASGVILAGYAVPDNLDGAWRREWVTKPIKNSSMTTTATLSGRLPLQAGPEGTWGIYGNAVVSLRDGSTTDLGEWTTVSVGDEIAFGTGPDGVLSAGPGGAGGRSGPQPSQVQAVAPQAVSGPAAYLLTAAGGTETWLYALTPDQETKDRAAGGGEGR